MSARIHEYPKPASQPTESAAKTLQGNAHSQSLLSSWFVPKVETKVMAEQTSKGVFLPYPLLGMLVTIAIVLISGLVALEVQVSNLSTTLLLRDADQRAQTQVLTDKLSTLEVYVHNDREKIIRLETQLDNNNAKKR